MPEGKWVRPKNVEFPSVWKRFNGKTLHKSGKELKFKVQDVTPDLHNDILDNMINIFLRDEPVCSNLNILGDPVAVNDIREVWTECLKQNVALVCLLENYDELNDPTLPKIVGCNVTIIKEKGVKESDECKSDGMRKIMTIMNEISDMFDCFEHYQCNEYLYAFGLSVDPAYRGQGVGLELLKARFELCRAVGLKATVTVFTAIASQKLAERAGFETHAEIEYEQYKKEGEVVFKNMKTKSVKLMAAKVD